MVNVSEDHNLVLSYSSHSNRSGSCLPRNHMPRPAQRWELDLMRYLPLWFWHEKPAVRVSPFQSAPNPMLLTFDNAWQFVPIIPLRDHDFETVPNCHTKPHISSTGAYPHAVVDRG